MGAAVNRGPRTVSRKASLRAARASVLWGLAFFALLQFGFWPLTNHWHPELRDPEYGYRRARLQALLAERPGRPLVLLLGSSRTGLGISPDDMEWEGDVGDAPVVFNFSITGGGPILELLCLKRLLADGIRPGWVLIEIHPALLHQEANFGEIAYLNISRLSPSDLRIVDPFFPPEARLYRRWRETCVVPWFSYRYCIMSRFAPGWLPWGARQDGWQGMDPCGWIPYAHRTVDADGYRRGLERARNEYGLLLDNYRISERADRALREVLALCRQEKVKAGLYVLPEGTEFRSWYPPASDEQLRTYLALLGRDYGVAVFNLRLALPDSCFFDSHHLLATAAVPFSKRFGREVVQPLLAGKRDVASAK